MLEDVKRVLRITHSLLDSEILETIETARAELIRVGVSSDMASDESDPLIRQAVKTYCLMRLANNEKMAEGYKTSWLYQLDCLRKSGGYGV